MAQADALSTLTPRKESPFTSSRAYAAATAFLPGSPSRAATAPPGRKASAGDVRPGGPAMADSIRLHLFSEDIRDVYHRKPVDKCFLFHVFLTIFQGWSHMSIPKKPLLLFYPKAIASSYHKNSPLMKFFSILTLLAVLGSTQLLHGLPLSAVRRIPSREKNMTIKSVIWWMKPTKIKSWKKLNTIGLSSARL